MMNEKEYLTFVNAIKNKIFRFSKRILVSTTEAEDATQDVLIKLWKLRERLDDLNSPEAFAMTLTKNHCLDRLKSSQAQNLRIIHNNLQDRRAGSLQHQIEINDTVKQLDKLIQQLPKKQGLIIQLRDIECYEFAEISIILDMKETAIRVALSRARKTLRDQIIQLHRHGIK